MHRWKVYHDHGLSTTFGGQVGKVTGPAFNWSQAGLWLKSEAYERTLTRGLCSISTSHYIAGSGSYSQPGGYVQQYQEGNSQPGGYGRSAASQLPFQSIRGPGVGGCSWCRLFPSIVAW
jgi:hypothetical protein